jgi:hypothetical protein
MCEVLPTDFGSRGLRTGAGSVLGLRVPADTELPLSLVVLRLRALELSEAIGGGLVENALTVGGGGVGYTFNGAQ